MSESSDNPNRRVEGTPKVVVTRHLMPSVEARMAELYETTLNSDDVPLTREQLAAMAAGIIDR